MKLSIQLLALILIVTLFGCNGKQLQETVAAIAFENDSIAQLNAANAIKKVMAYQEEAWNKGDLDGFLVDPNTMQSFIKKYRMEDEFEQHPIQIYSADVFIMLSKESSDIGILDKINLAIKTLTDRGELKKISTRWEETLKEK